MSFKDSDLSIRIKVHNFGKILKKANLLPFLVNSSALMSGLINSHCVTRVILSPMIWHGLYEQAKIRGSTAKTFCSRILKIAMKGYTACIQRIKIFGCDIRASLVIFQITFMEKCVLVIYLVTCCDGILATTSMVKFSTF